MTTWHLENDWKRDVTIAAHEEEEKRNHPLNPRMWMTGGGYMGRKVGARRRGA